MSGTWTRRAALAGLLSGAAGTALGGAPEASLRPTLRPTDLYRRSVPDPDSLIARADLGGKVGFAVADARTGLMLETRQPLVALPPASVAKAITALYALDALGSDFRFRTQLVAGGAVQDGVVQGDLTLVGGGDPTLDTDALAGMAQTLKAAGIREVRGAFRVFGGALPYTDGIDDSQPTYVGYNPAVSGLNLNYNRVHFAWRRNGGSYTVTMDARSERYRPDVRMARMRIVVRDMPLFTYDDQGSFDAWTVAQGALGNGGARWMPVRKPELYAGEVFQTFARSHGIALDTPRVATQFGGGAALVTHRSAPLVEILRDMLKYSTNLTAEAVGMTATVARTGRAASLRASANEMSDWAERGLGMSRARFVDHSGLGDASRVRAADMVKAIVAARGIRGLMKEHPIRDDDRKVIEDHPVTVHAKTGTLNFVSGLAGFLTAPDDSELAFAIFAADMPRRASLSRAERERPPGGREWNRRARILQQDLLKRWGTVYGA